MHNIEPHVNSVMRNPAFCLWENKDVDQLTAQLISAFVFATWIVQFLFFLNPKFQASSLLQLLYRPVCVGSGQKSRRPVFSCRGPCISTSISTTGTCISYITKIHLTKRKAVFMLPVVTKSYIHSYCFTKI